MYIVKFRCVGTGEWNEFNRYELLRVACSALCRNRGRAGIVINSANGNIEKKIEGDPDAYEKFDKLTSH